LQQPSRQQRRRQQHQQQQHTLQGEAWLHVYDRVIDVKSRLWSALAAVLCRNPQLAPLVLHIMPRTLSFVLRTHASCLRNTAAAAAPAMPSAAASAETVPAPAHPAKQQ
jgi:hypothetical protein